MPEDAEPTDEALEALGLYDPSAPTAEDRLAALRYLLARGVRLEHLVAAQRSGRVWSAVSLSVMWPEGRWLRVPEVAAAAGLPEGELRRLRAYAGLPDPGDEAVCPPEEIELWRSLQVGDELFGEDQMRHLVRAMGSAAATVAEAAVALARPMAPLQHTSERDYVAAVRPSAEALVVVAEGLDVLLRLHMQEAGARLMRVDEGDAVDRGGLPTFTVGFVDLVASTARSAGLGPDELAQAVADFGRIAVEAAGANATRLVKLLGDEAMYVDRDPAPVVRALHEVVRHVAAHPLLGGARAGAATGPVLPSEGDYFGPGANLAHRVVDEAGPGQVLVEALTAEALGLARPPVRVARLKGIAEPQVLHAVEPRDVAAPPD